MNLLLGVELERRMKKDWKGEREEKCKDVPEKRKERKREERNEREKSEERSMRDE